VKQSTAVRQYLKPSDVGSGPTMSMCTCWNRDVGRAKSPSGLVVCLDILDRWQNWHARAQVWQSFCTPGHTYRWEISFAVALVPRWPMPCRESNTCQRRVVGTYGHGLVVVLSQCRAISQPGTWIFSKRRAVVTCKRVASSASVSFASAQASGGLKCRLPPRKTQCRRPRCLARR
jgi:hypothetical protein